MEPHQVVAVVLWCAMAHIHDHLDIDVAPFLNITAPTPNCGKSKLSEICVEFVPRALPLSVYSSAAVNRVIEQYQPTLALDEIDQKGLNNAEDGSHLSEMLNGSQKRCEARSLKSVSVNNKDWEIRTFSTWCPKILCGIGGLKEQTRDRCIQIILARAPHGVRLPKWRDRDRDEMLLLHRRMVRWTNDNRDEIVAARKVVRDKLPPFLNERQCDSWELMFAIAHIVGREWEAKGINSCIEICTATGDTQNNPEILIGDLKEIFELKDKPDFLSTQDILEQLNWRDDRPWPTYSKGHGLTRVALAKLLKMFNVKPEQRRVGGENPVRGYTLEALSPVFTRYAVTEPDKLLKIKKKQRNGS